MLAIIRIMCFIDLLEKVEVIAELKYLLHWWKKHVHMVFSFNLKLKYYYYYYQKKKKHSQMMCDGNDKRTDNHYLL